MNHGLIKEIFVSVQGEGKYLGRTQCFIRFGSCNLACRYCDTDFKTAQTMSVEQVLNEVNKQAASSKTPLHSVSLTGGEPLYESGFCKNLLTALKSKGLTTYLETNGTLSEEFNTVQNLVDIVSMDIKIPSTAGAANSSFNTHANFLQSAAQHDLFAKVVINQSSTTKEIQTVCSLINANAPTAPLFIQPQNPASGMLCAPDEAWILPLLKTARATLKQVFFIPQMHKVFFVQ